MGGFCVYGQSLEIARTRAAKKVSEFEPSGEPGKKRRLTQAEWAERVNEKATGIFASMKPVRVSPEFDAPQFARDFIDCAVKTSVLANMAVMCMDKKLDAKGAEVKSKTSGLTLMTWVRYDDAKAKSR